MSKWCTITVEVNVVNKQRCRVTGGRVKLAIVRDVATLTMSNVECNDTGTYSLILTNDLGQDTVTSSVTIEGGQREKPLDQNRIVFFFIESSVVTV